MSRHFVALLALGILAAPLGAQGPGQEAIVRRGSEVRVYARLRYAAGRLVDLSPSAILVADRHGKATTVPRSEVLQVQIREGGRWIEIAPERLPSTCGDSEGPVVSSHLVVAPGARLRITGGRRRTVGTLAEWRGDTVVLARSGPALDTLLIGPDTRFEVSAGRHGAALPGFVTGFVLGAVGGGGGAASFCENFMGGSDDCGGAAAGGAALGGVALGFLGAVIGASIRGERWIDVPADSVRSFVAAGLRAGR